MEEYLHYMKTLRSQMNDVEDHAAKISADEQVQLTNIRTLEKDIESAKSGIKQVEEDTEKMKKAKGEICSKILENQKKIASLESDTYNLTKTLELIQQERVGLSAKLLEKRAYYSKVAEDLSAKLQKQQEWIKTKKIDRELKEHELVKERVDGQRSKAEGKAGADGNLIMDNLVDYLFSFINICCTKLESGHLSLFDREVMQIKLAIEEVKCRTNEFKPELKSADITALEEEYNALLSDKAGETEYIQSMEKQVEKLKEISQVVKCACGKEYTVAVNM